MTEAATRVAPGLAVGDTNRGGRIARVIDAAAGKYVWAESAPETVGSSDIVNVTPTAIPADLTELETAEPAAGQPSGITWSATVGTAGAYRTAQIVGGAWAFTDTMITAPTLRLAAYETQANLTALSASSTVDGLAGSRVIDGDNSTAVSFGGSAQVQQVSVLYDGTGAQVDRVLAVATSIDRAERVGMRVLAGGVVVHAEDVTSAGIPFNGTATATMDLPVPIIDEPNIEIQFLAEVAGGVNFHLREVHASGTQQLARVIWEQTDGTYLDNTAAPTVIAGTETVLASLADAPPAAGWVGSWTQTDTAGVVRYEPVPVVAAAIETGAAPPNVLDSNAQLFIQAGATPTDSEVFAMVGGVWTSIGPGRYLPPVQADTDAYAIDFTALRDGSLVWVRDDARHIMFDANATSGLAEPAGKPNAGIDPGYWVLTSTSIPVTWIDIPADQATLSLLRSHNLAAGQAVAAPAATPGAWFAARAIGGAAQVTGVADGDLDAFGGVGMWVEEGGGWARLPGGDRVGKSNVLPDAATTRFLIVIIENSADPLGEPDGAYFNLLDNWIQVAT